MSDSAHGHDEIHMPPNSWIPLSFSASMAMTFAGFLVHPAVWIVGLVWFVTTLVVWIRAARSEYLELPE